MSRLVRVLCAAAGLTAAIAPAAANDSIAGLGAGGIILGRTDDIAMESEKLFISMDEVKVDYVFRNQSDKDFETIVAFPMPDVEANPHEMPQLPDDASDNFLGFTVTVDGAPVTVELEQRAEAVGIDLTGLLQAQGVPVNPFAKPVFAALEKLPEDVAADWIDRGMILVDSYDDGSGWKNVRTPIWTLKSTYWWRTKFPAGKPVAVAHRYRPSVGASVGLNFYSGDGFQDPYAEYKQRYCIDKSFENAVAKAKAGRDGFPALSENRLQYVLTTGGNWALGTIGKFHLIVDKGDPKNLVSFCASGLKKTGPTRFELEATDYYPQRDLDILILQPAGAAN
ncbi:DUF4424 domain-containing protein [Mesorhizobium sp. LHD-90]|uniref:DUF4424 domain-containing protein n=1 Tax=Mesorhizobium sp. LHD-90 TaxID=3071414 RepID=UPI0027DFF8B7|nr:DUF4424 domain-containing protein [Mesorhizobium sp. LHD-90]MDQ6433524.1 DUF4424 domain-containing protein [Mesorhizobium sp. LHD-90]